MRTHVNCPVAAAIVLSLLSRAAFGGSTNIVYTYGGSFSRRIPADSEATKGWMQDAVVTVSDHVLICDVNVFVSIRHTAAFDLRLFLDGPGGVCVTLVAADPFTGYYEGQDYIATTFDDEADIGIAEGSPPFAGSFRPLDSLAVFDGLDAYGQWSLRVYDAYEYDAGCLDFFSVIVTVSVPDSVVEIPVPTAGQLTLLGLLFVLCSVARSVCAPAHD